jgi:hypothetical protein
LATQAEEKAEAGRTMFRRDMWKLKEKIEYESEVFDIYNPVYSSEEDSLSDSSPAFVTTCSLHGENGQRVILKTSVNKHSSIV